MLLTAEHRVFGSLAPKFSFLKSPTFNKALLEHKFPAIHFITNRFSCSKASAKRVVNALKNNQVHDYYNGNDRFGVLELVGTDGKYCAVVQYPIAVPESIPAGKKDAEWIRKLGRSLR